MIDEDLPHYLGGNRKKMHAIAVIGLFLFDQPGVGFVNKRGRLKRVAGPLVAKVAVGNFAKLGINQRNEMIEGAAIATGEGVE